MWAPGRVYSDRGVQALASIGGHAMITRSMANGIDVSEE